MNNFVAAVIVEVIIGLLSWLRGQKARTVRNFVVVVITVAGASVAVAVEVTMTKMKTTTMMIITAKQRRRI